jgi:hypothetical protein
MAKTMYDITKLIEPDFMQVRQSLVTSFGSSAPCMETAAQAVVRAFQTTLWDTRTDTSACGLVRCYITQRYDRLPPQLQRIANQRLAYADRTAIKYLVLLATTGDRPEWNDRTRSVAHQLIPLSSAEMIHQSPMIARMIKQFGFKMDALISANALELSMITNRTHNIFYVPEAAGSAYIPAQQEFVHAYGIQSVVGMGGILPYGHMFAVILFTKVTIPESVTKLFATLATDIKAVLASYGDKMIYATPEGVER